MPPAYLKAPDAAPFVASVDAPFVQGCTGKLRQTRDEARRALQRRTMLSLTHRDMNGREQDAGSAYHCANCGHWHTSHTSHFKAQRRLRERGI